MHSVSPVFARDYKGQKKGKIVTVYSREAITLTVGRCFFRGTSRYRKSREMGFRSVWGSNKLPGLVLIIRNNG